VSYQSAVNGTPGNTQRDVERLCEIEVGPMSVQSLIATRKN